MKCLQGTVYIKQSTLNFLHTNVYAKKSTHNSLQ